MYYTRCSCSCGFGTDHRSFQLMDVRFAPMRIQARDPNHLRRRPATPNYSTHRTNHSHLYYCCHAAENNKKIMFTPPSWIMTALLMGWRHTTKHHHQFFGFLSSDIPSTRGRPAMRPVRSYQNLLTAAQELVVAFHSYSINQKQCSVWALFNFWPLY